MNIGEANDTTILLRWLTADQSNPGPPTEQARAAAARLADRSRARLQAGMGGENLLAKWPVTKRDATWVQCSCLVRACPVHGRKGD